MALPAVHCCMGFSHSLYASNVADGPKVVRPPRTTDTLGGAFRSAFRPSESLPSDFDALLAAIDRSDNQRH